MHGLVSFQDDAQALQQLTLQMSLGLPHDMVPSLVESKVKFKVRLQYLLSIEITSAIDREMCFLELKFSFTAGSIPNDKRENRTPTASGEVIVLMSSRREL
jgi:hypothetical protein